MFYLCCFDVCFCFVVLMYVFVILLCFVDVCFCRVFLLVFGFVFFLGCTSVGVGYDLAVSGGVITVEIRC